MLRAPSPAVDKPELKLKNVEIKLRSSNNFFNDGDADFEKFVAS